MVNTDEGVDPGTLYMLPPDVAQAFNDTAYAAQRMVGLVGLYLLAAKIFPGTWPYFIENLRRQAEVAIAGYAIIDANSREVIIRAVQERRTGCITNIGL